jgi:hypothetical protein
MATGHDHSSHGSLGPFNTSLSVLVIEITRHDSSNQVAPSISGWNRFKLSSKGPQKFRLSFMRV